MEYSLHSNGEIHHLMAVENPTSFTALLELPPNQALELLHSPNSYSSPVGNHGFNSVNPNSTHYPNVSVSIDAYNSPETNSLIKVENQSSAAQRSPPLVPAKRKDREKNKAKCNAKKNKNGDDEKLGYVHVRARRGQATDRHSLAERARREKINARMKLLKELVPGCDKTLGTASVLDEIINHVQWLQRQVEFLSTRLAIVNSRGDYNLDSTLAAVNGSGVNMDFNSSFMPQVDVNRNRQVYQQQWEYAEEKMTGVRFMTPDKSILSSETSH